MKISSLCAKETKDKVTTKPHVLPIYATSSFVFDDINQGIDIFKGETTGHVYSRYANPTVETVSDKIAQLAVAGSDLKPFSFMTSSGMSAISTVITSLLSTGDHIITQGNLYGGTTELFQKVIARAGDVSHFTSLKDLTQFEIKLKKHQEIKLCYFETPANPTMSCGDIEALCSLCQKHNVITVIDNTFCTPYLQQPLKLGADIVIHSTTKYLNGHGNSIAGIIIGKDKKYKELIFEGLKLLGTNCSPWEAWLTYQGLKTLALRMDRHSSNAMKLATYLESHSRISRVNYNGLESHPDHELAKKQMKDFGGMMSFEIEGSVQDGIAFMNNLNFCTLAPTLGDVDTLVLHPASSSHLRVDRELRERNGITDGLIRISVGIEDISDIIEDIENALKK